VQQFITYACSIYTVIYYLQNQEFVINYIYAEEFVIY